MSWSPSGHRKEDVISCDRIYGSRETTGLFNVYTGDFEYTINNIKHTIIWVYGHLIYRERIIKWVFSWWLLDT